MAYAILIFHTLNSNAVFHTVTLYPCGNAWEGPPAMTWLSAGMRARGGHLHPLVSFLTVWGGTEARSQECGTPAAKQLRDHKVPCRWASASPVRWIFTSLSSLIWLTLMGSFISILIGGLSKGAYSPHFFWRNLPSLKPSTTPCDPNAFFPLSILFYLVASFSCPPSLTVPGTQAGSYKKITSRWKPPFTQPAEAWLGINKNLQ